MGAMDTISSFKEVLADLGVAGFLIAVLIAGIGVLWRAYQKSLERNRELTDKMLGMAKEVTTMIERITGR